MNNIITLDAATTNKAGLVKELCESQEGEPDAASFYASLLGFASLSDWETFPLVENKAAPFGLLF